MCIQAEENNVLGGKEVRRSCTYRQDRLHLDGASGYVARKLPVMLPFVLTDRVPKS